MKIYLAGPDIFRPDVLEWAEAARSLCRQYGFDPLLAVDLKETEPAKIFEANLDLIRKAQIVCANLDPFRGSEPDSGTAFEVGYALALGKKVCGYVTDMKASLDRTWGAVKRDDGMLVDDKGFAIEDFELPCNLMLAVPCKVVGGGLEACLQAIRGKPVVAALVSTPKPQELDARTININELWRSAEPMVWDQAIERYWGFVRPENIDLEHSLNSLDLQRIQGLSAQGWYDFLYDEYFRWKYTAPNRYATTTIQLQKHLDGDGLAQLDTIRHQLLKLQGSSDIKGGLKAAMSIRGLGTAGASGLLALMYPEHFATVDQFVVKALREIDDLPESGALEKMNPMSLSINDGELLIGILSRKARELNQLFGTSVWTPRKIDMVLWTYGR